MPRAHATRMPGKGTSPPKAAEQPRRLSKQSKDHNDYPNQPRAATHSNFPLISHSTKTNNLTTLLLQQPESRHKNNHSPAVLRSQSAPTSPAVGHSEEEAPKVYNVFPRRNRRHTHTHTHDGVHNHQTQLEESVEQLGGGCAQILVKDSFRDVMMALDEMSEMSSNEGTNEARDGLSEEEQNGAQRANGGIARSTSDSQIHNIMGNKNDPRAQVRLWGKPWARAGPPRPAVVAPPASEEKEEEGDETQKDAVVAPEETEKDKAEQEPEVKEEEKAEETREERAAEVHAAAPQEPEAEAEERPAEAHQERAAEVPAPAPQEPEEKEEERPAEEHVAAPQVPEGQSPQQTARALPTSPQGGNDSVSTPQARGERNDGQITPNNNQNLHADVPIQRDEAGRANLPTDAQSERPAQEDQRRHQSQNVEGAEAQNETQNRNQNARQIDAHTEPPQPAEAPPVEGVRGQVDSPPDNRPNHALPAEGPAGARNERIENEERNVAREATQVEGIPNETQNEATATNRHADARQQSPVDQSNELVWRQVTDPVPQSRRGEDNEDRDSFQLIAKIAFDFIGVISGIFRECPEAMEENYLFRKER